VIFNMVKKSTIFKKSQYAESTLIRISLQTRQDLKKRGQYGDSFDSIIQKLLRGKKK